MTTRPFFRYGQAHQHGHGQPLSGGQSSRSGSGWYINSERGPQQAHIVSLMKDRLHLPKAISTMCLSFLSKNQVIAIQTPRDTLARAWATAGAPVLAALTLAGLLQAGCRPCVLPAGAEESERHGPHHVVYS